MGRRRWERWSPAGIRGGEGPVERGVGGGEIEIERERRLGLGMGRRRWSGFGEERRA
jgi:hypothetical protein